VKRRRGLWLSLAATALFLVIGRAAAVAFAEFRWFDALGATEVWEIRYGQAAVLRLIALLAGAAIAFVNLWAVRHSVVSLVMPRRIGNIEIGEEIAPRTLMAIVIAVSLVLGIGFAIPASDWHTFALARLGVPFNETDPYFNSDLGFFVYWLPFERAAYAWTSAVAVIVGAVVVTCYALTPSLRWEQGRLHVSAYVRRHIALLGGGALALMAWSFRLDAFSVLSAGSGANGAFAAVDEQLGIPVSIFLQFVFLAAAFVVAWAGWTGQSRVALTVVTGVLLLAPTMRFALPAVVRWASAPVDPEVRERPYEAARASFTRRAFAVDRIRPLSRGEALRSLEDAAMSGIWDPAALRAALERTRRRAPIVSPQSLTGSLAGPVLVGIEGRSASEPQVAPWTVVRTLASVTDDRGAIVRVDDRGRFPLDDEVLSDVIVYPGARGYIVRADTSGSIAAPEMHSFGSRLAEAWSQQDYRLLSESALNARVVRRRDARERVAALAPFFAVGSTVYPIVHGDSLMWAVELYSSSRSYPLARRLTVPAGDVTYYQHAATALVQAATGRVTLVPVGDPDPLARTWIRVLGASLVPVAGVSSSLLAMLPPAIDGAVLQADAFAAVGLRGEGGTRRHIASLDGGDTLVASAEPSLIWLPSAAAGAWPVPMVDARDRIAGVLLVVGGQHRMTRWFPAPDTLHAWGQLLDQLSGAATDDNDRGLVARAAGRVRLLPMSSGQLVALQPHYAWPADGPPSVSRVVAIAHDSVRVAASAGAALGVPILRGPSPTSPAAQRERLRELYAEMRAALARNDWVAFGAAFDALGVLLERR